MDCAAVEDRIMSSLASSARKSSKQSPVRRTKKAYHKHKEIEVVSILTLTDTCFHCGRETLDGVDRCECEVLLAEYGAMGCSCCGYSYADLRGQRDEKPTSTYYPQYRCRILEPCDKCSPKFVERMRTCQKADLEDHEAWEQWEWEEACRERW